MAHLSLCPAPCFSGAPGAGGAWEAGGAQILQLTVTCPLPLTTHTRGCQDRAVPQGSHRDPRPPGAHEAVCLPLCPPCGSGPWLLPGRPHSCGSLAGPRVGEGQIPGAGASQKGVVSPERPRPRHPLPSSMGHGDLAAYIGQEM